MVTLNRERSPGNVSWGWARPYGFEDAVLSGNSLGIVPSSQNMPLTDG